MSESLFQSMTRDFQRWLSDLRKGDISPINKNEGNYWPDNKDRGPKLIKRGFMNASMIPTRGNYDSRGIHQICWSLAEKLKVHLRVRLKSSEHRCAATDRGNHSKGRIRFRSSRWRTAWSKTRPEMRFLIANTFTDSLAKLTGEEQKAAKTTAFDLQTTPSQPGLSFHKVGKSKDPNFWSVRVNLDVRIIVHRTPDSTVLCYVDHHDDAYKWAVRRRLEVHPKTGAAQLVEVRETVQEITVPRVVDTVQEGAAQTAAVHRDNGQRSLELRRSR